MDLECINLDNKLIPYLLCFYDGINLNSYFISDYKNYDDLIFTVIKDICKNKYKNYRIYLHNLAKFDSIFLLKSLTKIKFAYVDPIIHDGKVISIQFTYNNIVIHFRDSYLLLPSSLKKLGKSFNNSNMKDIFPFSLNDITYKGPVPDITLFNNITLNEYLNYCLKYKDIIWDFKTESINYCKIDCLALYEILIKFNNIIFSNYKLNINNFPTLPSLSFGIYRCIYLKENVIPCLNGSIFKDIKASYTGGSVDMYIPKNKNNEKTYCYDVNSLYPFVMLDNPIPVGNPIYFEGDIRKFDNNAFGFFNVDVITPDYLKHPIIQIHHKVNNVVKTISPLGKFSMMIFSKEMDNAIKYGYNFKIKSGYLFKQEFIFKDFIEQFYKIRKKYPKSDPMNYIAKIIMNSLYGRFGMQDSFNDIAILAHDEYLNFENKFKDSILDILELDDKYLVKFNMNNNQIPFDNLLEKNNINVAIASSITAYSRIFMSQFKNRNDFDLLYSDTDSIFINKPLNNDLISDNILGKLKLEYVLDKAIFLAPKVYALLTEDQKLIIKVKGLTKQGTDQLNMDNFENLLNINSNIY
jgi:hypothetical protein